MKAKAREKGGGRFGEQVDGLGLRLAGLGQGCLRQTLAQANPPRLGGNGDGTQQRRQVRRVFDRSDATESSPNANRTVAERSDGDDRSWGWSPTTD